MQSGYLYPIKSPAIRSLIFNKADKTMKLVIQRVTHASVSIQNQVTANIGKGMLVLLGIEVNDSEDDIEWLTSKLIKLRIFDDHRGVMNLDIQQIDGEILLVSQFTLLASTKKGNRPSYIRAARPEVAIPLYEKFIHKLQSSIRKPVRTGTFGAEMAIELTNDGPVTIIIDSKNRM